MKNRSVAALLLLVVVLVLALCTGGVVGQKYYIHDSCSGRSSCIAEIYQAVQNCVGKSWNTCGIYFNKGVYHLNDTQYPMYQPSIILPKNLTTEFHFEAYNGPVEFIIYYIRAGIYTQPPCKNLYFKGISFDMDRLPYTLAQVTSVSATSTILSFNPNTYPFYPKSNTLYTWLYSVQAILQYDPATNLPSIHGLDDYLLQNPANLTLLSPNQLQLDLGSRNAPLKVNQYYILRHQVYSLNTFTFLSCQSVHLQDINIYSAAGMGAYFYRAHDIVIDHFNILKKPGRPMSINADGMHFQSCYNSIQIKDSVIQGQGDDGMNVHGEFQDVETITESKIQVGKNGVINPNVISVQVGDLAQFQDRRTFQKYWEAQVTSIENGWVSFNKPIPVQQVKKYDLMTSATSISPSVHIQNTVFKDNRARGALLKTSNLLVDNCTFQHTTGAGCQADPDGCFWFESNVVKNWTVKNSRFIGCNYATAAVMSDVYMMACTPVWNNGVPTTNGNPVEVGTVFGDIKIENNVFEQSMGQAAVGVYGVNGLVVQGNKVQYQGRPPFNMYISNSVGVGPLASNTCNGQACVVKTAN